MIKIAQRSKDIVQAIEKREPKNIKVLLKDTSKEQRECCVNDTQVAKALMKNFDVAVANVLFQSGFSLFSCLSSRHSHQTGELKYSILEHPSSDFWLYVCTPGRIKKNDLTAFANMSMKMLAENNWSTTNPKRAALAEFRDILKHNHPKFFHDWANMESWEIYQALFSRCNKNFCSKDWNFFNALPTLFWKDTAHPADWSTQYEEIDIPPMLNVVKNVPDAQQALEKYYKSIKHSRKIVQQLSYSPTGKIDNIQLLDEIELSKRAKVLASIKSLVNNDRLDKYLGISECEILGQILLGNLSTDTDLWRNFPQRIKNILPNSETLVFDSLPEMMVTLGHTKSVARISKVDIQTIFGQTSTVRETIEYYGEKSQWQSLITLFPDLKDWRDAYGNSLGHWIASSRDAHSFLDIIKDPAWLKPNAMGYYVRDILCSKVSDETLQEYDQYISKVLARQEKQAIEKNLNIGCRQLASHRKKI